MTVVRRELPESVFEQRDKFLWRGRSMGKVLEPRLGPERFRAWTFAPGSESDERLLNLRSWHWSEHFDPGDLCAGFVAQRMREARATWVVPDSLFEPGERSPSSKHITEAVAAGRDRLYVVRKPDARAILTALRAGENAVGALGLLTTAEVPIGRATEGQVTAIAEQAIVVAPTAYDVSDHLLFFERRD